MCIVLESTARVPYHFHFSISPSPADGLPTGQWHGAEQPFCRNATTPLRFFFPANHARCRQHVGCCIDYCY